MIVLRSIFSGMAGLPQSRRVANVQSSVMIRPWHPRCAPARRARPWRSRVPTQYIWNIVFGLAAATSSIGLLANDERPDRGARLRGGPGDRDLAVGMHGLHAGRRDDHR